MPQIVHDISVSGYQAAYCGSMGRLVLGTYGSYGVEQIQLTLGPDWAGLVVTANFVTSAGNTPVVVPTSGLFNVPPEATAQQGTGSMVLQGTASGVQIYTVNIPFIVLSHADLSGQAPAQTPDKWEQYIVQVQGIVDKAVPPGGNIGDVLTKTADGNAWQPPQGGGGGGGTPGQDGGYYTPSIEQTAEDTADVSWTASDDTMPPVEPVTLTLPQGKPGQDGTAAGFGEISATATQLPAGSQPTADVETSGLNTAKNFSFSFGIPAPQSEGSGDAYTKAESDARYAPLESAICPAATGNPAAIKHTLAFPIQSIKILGLCTQAETPQNGNVVPIQKFDGGTVTVEVTDGAEQTVTAQLECPYLYGGGMDKTRKSCMIM